MRRSSSSSSSLPRGGAGNRGAARVSDPAVDVAYENAPNPPNVSNNDASGPRRGPGYTTVEDLMIAKSFIEASEDATIGVSQTGTAFQNRMVAIYNRRKNLQYQMDLSAYQNSSQAGRDAMALANGGFKEPQPYPDRTPTSITGRWKKHISYRISKFMGIEDTTPRGSGTSDEDFYLTCLAHFEQRTNIKGFENLKHVLDYLRGKAKWVHWRMTNNDDNPNPDRPSRPMGNRRAKEVERASQALRTVMHQEFGDDDGDAAVAIATPTSSVVMSRPSFTAPKSTVLHNAGESLNKMGDAFTALVNENRQKHELQQLMQQKAQVMQNLPTPERKEWAQEDRKNIQDQERELLERKRSDQEAEMERKRRYEDLEFKDLEIQKQIKLEESKVALAKLRNDRRRLQREGLELEGGNNSGERNVNDLEEFSSSSDDE